VRTLQARQLLWIRTASLASRPLRSDSRKRSNRWTNPDLVVRDQKGEIYTVRYDAVNAMLLNEFLKEHRKVEAQEHKLREQDGSIQKQQATVEELREEIRRLTETVKVGASEIQKVSARLQTIDPASTRVAADRR
jgi:cell shape-determining protein MreC